MSLEPSAHDVSSRSLDLNCAAAAHQEEPESSGEARKTWDLGTRDQLSVGLLEGHCEEHNNVREAEVNEGITDEIVLVEKSVVFLEESMKKDEEASNPAIPILESNNYSDVKEAMTGVKDGGLGDSKHSSGVESTVREGNLANEIDLHFLKQGPSGEARNTPKSNPVVEIPVVGEYPDDKHFQSNEGQECKSAFSFGDMVWGKVRSHPWWPGQIYHPSFSSEMALKHQKKDCFLVAYFGDCSFAWNDVSQLKPFEFCFRQMAKQSNLKAFVDAVDESLREIARRTEIGMTCACIADELIADLQQRVFENAGIKECTCCPTLNHYLVASSFETAKLLYYVQDLARYPCEKFEKLELVKVKAQLKAIYRSRGYPELPEFRSDGGVLNNGMEVSTPEKEEAGKDAEYKKEVLLDGKSSKETKKGRGRLPDKKNQIEEVGRKLKSLPELMKQTVNSASFNGKKLEDGTPPAKKKKFGEDGRKEKSLPELMRQTADCASLDRNKVKGRMLSASKSLRKKRNIIGSDSFYYEENKKKKLNLLGDLDNIPASSSSRMRAVKIGQRISQVANKMKFSRNYKKVRKDKTKENGRTPSVHGLKETPRDTALVKDYPAPSVMLSQLYLSAQGPTKASRFEPAIVDFFVSWRDSQASGSPEENLLNLVGSRSGHKRLAEFDLAPVVTKSVYIQDSYWSDVIFEESPKKVRLSRVRKRKGKSKIKAKKKKAVGKSLLSGSLEPTLNIIEPISDCSAIDEQQREGRLVNFSDNNTVEECNPAALILNFSDANTLPTESNLITIFSHYGPLRVADTEVSGKRRRASVVFKRGADAEVAFSSAGKFSAFGPALVSYRLRYSTSPSPDTTHMKDRHSQTDGGTSVLPDSVVVPTDGRA